jgi:hypothetical protein
MKWVWRVVIGDRSGGSESDRRGKIGGRLRRGGGEAALPCYYSVLRYLLFIVRSECGGSVLQELGR